MYTSFSEARWVAWCVLPWLALGAWRLACALYASARRRGTEHPERAFDERSARHAEQLAQLTGQLLLAQDDERAHIARELHDELGQRLSALRFALANTRHRYGRAPTSILPNLQELDGMLEAALHCTNTIVAGLRPPLLEQLGLAASAECLAQRIARQTGLRLELDLLVERDCGAEASVAAYRVLQESLTNVRRHAGATRVVVRLHAWERSLLLEVRDDGRGFPRDAAARPADRNGLLGMRERALALGGELRTDNAPGGGARVLLTLPLPPCAEALAS